MINRLIQWSLRNRFLVVCGMVLLAVAGVMALVRIPVDAIPDLSENQVIVFADWTGRSPQEVEDQVTYPLSVNLQGLAGVKTVRANSMFGFSLITILLLKIFKLGLNNSQNLLFVGKNAFKLGDDFHEFCQLVFDLLSF